MTFAEIVRAYLIHASAIGLFTSTSRTERERTLREFSAHCTLDLSDCKPYMLCDWIESHDSWRSISTKRSKANQVNAVLNWAVRQGRIDRNPFLGVRYAEAAPRQPMADCDYARIADMASKPFERAFRFLRLTGLRLSELCNLLWSDVDLVRGVLMIRKHKTRRFTGKSKCVPLTAEAVAVLGSPGEGCVFLNSRGTPWTRQTLAKHFARLKARHGIKTAASLHGLRHAVGTTAVARGAPIKLVSMMLGHASVTTTERFYCHLENEIEAIRAAAELARPG